MNIEEFMSNGNLENMKDLLKESLNTPATASLDILNYTKTFANIAMMAKQGKKEMTEIREMMPEQYYEVIDEKINLMNDMGNASMRVFKELCNMLPICQRLDNAKLESNERLREVIADLEEELGDE